MAVRRSAVGLSRADTTRVAAPILVPQADRGVAGQAAPLIDMQSHRQALRLAEGDTPVGRGDPLCLAGGRLRARAASSAQPASRQA